ncbi:hypothetical protein [Ferrovum myxofaciens]|uniref:hypothetical protein n=1 Tax=Ferrovum myxofaciens TaxID=416213 RepID=UPI0023531AB7|nr:hypothetical protein [Ferrovum myxofaciens]MBU6995857.1 hypothetical protein [Ferrovum myxofaciens]
MTHNHIINLDDGKLAGGIELIPIHPHASDEELKVISWIRDGHEILWIPIYEVSPGPDGWAKALALEARHGDARRFRHFRHLFKLPIGIKGWLFPAHLEDTDVVFLRESADVMHFGAMVNKATGMRMTYCSDPGEAVPVRVKESRL